MAELHRRICCLCADVQGATTASALWQRIRLAGHLLFSPNVNRRLHRYSGWIFNQWKLQQLSSIWVIIYRCCCRAKACRHSRVASRTQWNSFNENKQFSINRSTTSRDVSSFVHASWWHQRAVSYLQQFCQRLQQLKLGDRPRRRRQIDSYMTSVERLTSAVRVNHRRFLQEDILLSVRLESDRWPAALHNMTEKYA